MVPLHAGQGPGVELEPEDAFALVGPAHGLARYIPTTTLRHAGLPRTLAFTLRRLAPLPQYRFTARIINRLFGGPLQPLFSSMGASFITDLVWHQGVVLAVNVAIGMPPYPNPFFSTTFAIGWGLTVGLFRLGYFQESLNVQRVALQLTGGDSMLARQAGKLIKHAMHTEDGANVLGPRVDAFIDTHHDAVVPELVTFAQAVRMGDENAVDLANDMAEYALAYGENEDNDAFREGVRQLARVVPISPAPWSDGAETRLLVTDGAGVGVVVGLLAAEWAVWGVGVARGKPFALPMAISGGAIAGVMVLFLGAMALSARFTGPRQVDVEAGAPAAAL